MCDDRVQYTVGYVDGEPVECVGHDWAILSRHGGQWSLIHKLFYSRREAIDYWDHTIWDLEMDPAKRWDLCLRRGEVRLAKVRTYMFEEDE